ncbi:MAG: hypothetical protein F9K45_01185 [Melioribacteraceae bacterium]|nr:MAG: hypothetical protein F9K45_01185 [Melioribacteraceae bacterium]
MLKKIIFPALLVGLILVTATQLDAQQKSFERRTKKQVEKKETVYMDKCTQMSKCIDKIAADSEMRNEMLQKLNDEFDKATSVPIGLEDIQRKPLELNKSKMDKEKTEKQSSQLFNKLPYKRK